MAKIINASTPAGQRRLNDKGSFYQRSRIVSIRPGSGEVRIKASLDEGATYDVMETFTTNRYGPLPTYDQMLEIECTADAVLVLGN